MRPLVALLLLAGCDAVFGLDTIAATDAASDDSDGGADAFVFGPWSTPVQVAIPVTGADTVADPSLTSDETRITFTYASAGETSIYEAPLVTPTTIGAMTASRMNPGVQEASAELSPDGLTMYYLTATTGLSSEIAQMKRAALGGPWTDAPVPPGLNTAGDDRPGSPDATGNRIVIMRDGDLLELVASDEGWMPVTTTAALNADGNFAVNPHLSADGLTVVFSAGAAAANNLYIAHRSATLEPWSTPELLELGGPAGNKADPWMSADQRRLYFSLDNVAIFFAER